MRETSKPSEFELFKAGLAIQSRVVVALILREMRVRYGRSKLGYFWAVAEPMGYVAALSVLFEFGKLPSPFGSSMALFFALGIIPLRLFISLGNQLGGAFNANEALLTYPIVKEIDTVAARFILETLTTVMVLIITLTVLSLTLNLSPPNSLPDIALGFGLLAGFGFGVGLLNAVITRFFGSWQNIFNIITAPMLFISAVFYSLASLPLHVRDLLVWNPVVHGIEQIRLGYYHNYRAPGLDIGYLFWFAILACLAGLIMERTLRMNR